MKQEAAFVSILFNGRVQNLGELNPRQVIWFLRSVYNIQTDMNLTYLLLSSQTCIIFYVWLI